MVFNGEIYNYRELRESLSGYTFTSETDTEVLLHLYEEEGPKCLQRLRGMFAFAIWDERAEQLFLACDRLGQKPLFFRNDEHSFWFGSTIKTILADDDVTATPDLGAIRQYLTYQYVPHPETGFQEIQQLRPGEYMLVDEDGVTRDSYWSLSFADQFDASPAVLADRLRTELKKATRLRMRSDVPVGVFLSGGLDSSIVTALMDEVSNSPVNTYSVGFDQEAYNELEFARELADEYDTNHHEYSVTPDSIDVLPKLVEHCEMPFGDPSALPTYYVSQAASKDSTVILSGDAGDEMFAGYTRYTHDKIARQIARIPELLRQFGIRWLDSLPPQIKQKTVPKYARRGLATADGDDVRRYARLICHAMDSGTAEIWDGPEPENELQWLDDNYRRTDGPTRTERLMQLDIQTYLPADLLVKVDRASMAHSLEVRSPFLDHKFMEFAARIPAKYKWRRGEKKWLLKRAFKQYLPDNILTRKKQGFAVPIDEWFRTELNEYAHERVERLGNREPFDLQNLRSLLVDHETQSADNGREIWDLMMLEGWYNRFIDDISGAA